MLSILSGLVQRAERASVVRHFAYTFAAVFALQTVTIVQDLGNALVAGSMPSAGDLNALKTAVMYATGTAVLRVIVPAIASLAKSVTTA